jgi:hypothetical protein
MVLRIIIERSDHEVLEVDRVIHGLKDNYRQIRPWYLMLLFVYEYP